MDKQGLTIGEFSRAANIPYDSAYRIYKGKEPKNKIVIKRVTHFLLNNEDAILCEVNQVEDELLKSLDLSTQLTKAFAISDIVEGVKKGGKYEYLTKYKTASEVILEMYQAIVAGVWTVKLERCFVIKLPTGHYLKKIFRQGDKVLEWKERFDSDTVRSTNAEELERMYPEYKEFIKEQDEESLIRYNGEI